MGKIEKIIYLSEKYLLIDFYIEDYLDISQIILIVSIVIYAPSVITVFTDFGELLI